MRNFPDFIEAVVDANKGTKIPERFRRWAAISAVAGALGRKVWYDAGAFTIFPHMYICLVGPPASGKSVSLILPYHKVFKALTTPIGTRREDREWNPRLEKYRLEDTPLYWVKDRITPEKLALELESTHRIHLDLSTPDELWHENSMTLITGEFGTFMQQDAQYAQMILTELWNGEADYEHKTKSMGVNLIRGPALNWIACATPEQFISSMPGNARSQGLLSRMLPIYFWPAEEDQLEDDIYFDSANDTTVDMLREDLSKIAQVKGSIRFDDRIFEKARQDVKSKLGNKPNDPNMSEYTERRTSHILKLAMVICAARRATRVITEDDWETAKRILLDAEEDMPKALRGFGAGRVEGAVIETEKYVRALLDGKEGGVPVFKVRRNLLKGAATPQEVEATLKAMHEAGIIRMEGNVVYLRS